MGHVIAVGQTAQPRVGLLDAAHGHIKLLVQNENPHIKGMPLARPTRQSLQGSKAQ